MRLGLFSRRRWAVLVAMAVALLYLVAMAAALVTARNAMRAGAAEIRQVESGITAAQLERSPESTLQLVEPHLARARDDFAGADNRLEFFAPVLSRLSWVPGIGQELAAAPVAARMGHDAGSGALGLVQQLQPVLTTGKGARGRGNALRRPSSLPSGALSGSPPTRVLVARLANSHAAFAQDCGSLDAADTARNELSAYSAPSLRTPLQTVNRQLPRLQRVCRALETLPGLLGYGQPARYLVAYLNPNQIRATGGFLGSAGLLTVRAGRISQQFTGTWLHDNLSYPPPEPLIREDGEPGWLFRDSNWSPNFPTSAALERFFAGLDLGWRARGVINLTPQAVADAVRALGPLYVPEYHRWVTGSNVAVLADYYAHFAGNVGPSHAGSGDTQRKQFFAIVAGHLFSRLESLTPGEIVRLATDMDDAVTHGDLLLNFTDPDAQALVNSIGASGSVDPTSSDYLYVVDSNISYNKINGYVRESVSYHADVLPNRWVRSDLTLTYYDQPAPAYIYKDSYGPGAGKTGTPADYGDFVRILVPAGAQLLTQSGWLRVYPGGPVYGKTMFSGYLIVRKGEIRTVHMRYLLPPNVFSSSHGADYRLVVQHQPGSHPAGMQVSVNVDGRPVFLATATNPDIDWSESIPIRLGKFQPIPLAPQPAVTVSPGHWIEPHTYLGR